jgi:glutathione S-transferase
LALKLYHSPSSVCSAKVRLVLAEKRIPWDSEIVDICRGEQFAPAYLGLNPAAVVPTLVHDGRAVRESLVICEYLEDAFPQPSLRPRDHLACARMRVWCKDIETFMSSAAVGVIFPATDRFEVAKLSAAERASYYAGHPNRRLAERKQRWAGAGFADPDARSATLTFHKFLQKLNAQLDKTKWLAGEAYSLADAETAPYVAILDVLGWRDWWQSMPRIGEWYERVKARPSFGAAITEVIPQTLRSDMAARGVTAWPDIAAIVATAEPYNGRSPWAMRAEAL